MSVLIRNAHFLDSDATWLLVREGRIAELSSGQEPDAERVIDAGGGWVLPGFVDAHCHILPTGIDLQRLHLGACTTHEEVLEAVLEEHCRLPEGEWLMAVHYDQTKYAGAQHITRWQLDGVSMERPILLRHSSGHASVVNSAALAAAGYTDSKRLSADYMRGADGRLSGVMLEKAHERINEATPEPDLEQMVEAILTAGRAMREVGITCASDMMTGRWSLEKELTAYRLASERGCAIRLRLYCQWGAMFGKKALDPAQRDELIAAMNPELCKVAGVKVFADGAIGSATAAIYGKYLTTGSDGRLMYTPTHLKERVRVADEAGLQVAVHTIGDRSTDAVLGAFEAAPNPSRHRLEHAMMLSDAQCDRIARAGCTVVMQPEFLVRFAHAYAKQLGPERTKSLKRFRSLLDRGVPLGFSSDRPIVTGEPWVGLRASVERPIGFDPSEGISFAKSLRAYTEEAASANGDKGFLGSLRPGAAADLQIVGEEPGETWSVSPKTTYLGVELGGGFKRSNN